MFVSYLAYNDEIPASDNENHGLLSTVVVRPNRLNMFWPSLLDLIAAGRPQWK